MRYAASLIHKLTNIIWGDDRWSIVPNKGEVVGSLPPDGLGEDIVVRGIGVQGVQAQVYGHHLYELVYH